MQTSRELSVDELNRKSLDMLAMNLLADVLVGGSLGKAALVSSFGAESAVLLHMVSRVAADTPVIFVDTGMLFEETLAYQLELTRKFGLGSVQRVSAPSTLLQNEDPQGMLNADNPERCCYLRKVAPLNQALGEYDAWITGRKRFQSGTRAQLKVFEADDASRRIKLNPLAFWELSDLKAYATNHNMPPHPLVAKGYPSLGCRPCTSQVKAGEDQRAGRWRGLERTECGIHLLPDATVEREIGA